MEPSLKERKSRLSPNQRLVFEHRIRGEQTLGTLGTALQNFATEPRPARLPLSYAQQRLWFLDRLEGGKSTEYNMPEALRLRGELDRGALERAINAIVERHESLRTHFAEVDGEPVQVIEPVLRVAVPMEDLSLLSAEVQGEELRVFVRR